MSEYPDITLHYFDLRGRGQFIRGLLTHRELPFTDDRIVLAANNSNWPEIRNDRTRSGDFQKPPSFQWGDLILNEVLVILDFIHKKLGDDKLLDEEAQVRHSMLTSSAFLDLLTPCINLIWCDVFHPGTDVPAATAIMKRRMTMHLATVNQTLEEWQWLDSMKDRPTLAAEAVLWEALDMIRLTFDDHVSFEELDVLSAFYDTCAGAESFRKLLAEKPQHITGRPGETDALVIIHKSLAEQQ